MGKGLVSLLLCAALSAFGSNVDARGRHGSGGSHGGAHARSSGGSHTRSAGGSHSSSTRAPSHRSGAPKTSSHRTNTPAGARTHVKSYTKKDGTHVGAHDRRTPGTPRAQAATRTPAAKAAPRLSASAAGAPRSRPETVVPRSTAPRSTRACATCPRNSHGRIARSEEAKRQFMRQTGFARGRPGYVIDHIKPLRCGGGDTPGNMQWQTIAAAKAKDKSEAKCR